MLRDSEGGFILDAREGKGIDKKIKRARLHLGSLEGNRRNASNLRSGT